MPYGSLLEEDGGLTTPGGGGAPGARGAPGGGGGGPIPGGGGGGVVPLQEGVVEVEVGEPLLGVGELVEEQGHPLLRAPCLPLSCPLCLVESEKTVKSLNIDIH